MAVADDPADPAGEDGTKTTLARTQSPLPGHADSEGAIFFHGCVRMRHSGQTVRIAHLVLMTAVQFVLFEPNDWVPGNDEFEEVADEFLQFVSGQLKWLKAKYHGG